MAWPPVPMGSRGLHHKQLNMTLVKVSEGTDKPHEIEEREKKSSLMGCSHNAQPAFLGEDTSRRTHPLPQT